MGKRSLWLPGTRTVLGALVGAALAAGCADSGSFEDPMAPDANTVQPGDPDAGPLAPTALPFPVDAYFAPSGYMGDGSSPGAINDIATCADPRPSTWVGTCHFFTYTPSTLKWAGVYWQYPDGNWGDFPGLVVPVGATSIKFSAWGATGTEKISFMSGLKDFDGFEAKTEVLTLGTTPTEYTIDLSAAIYTDVIGGFGWVTDAAMATGPISFYVDDIHWQ
jgi:hypothetical protein